MATNEGFQAMSSAVIDAPVSPPKPRNGTLFSPGRSDLRLVKIARYPIHGPGGRTVGEDPGQTFAFRNGQLFVPHDGDVTLEDGRKIPASEALEWLRSHRLYGDAVDGFVEVKTAAPPVSQAEIGRAMEMNRKLDLDGLAEMLREEREGWDRPDVTQPLELAISEITAALARAEENARAEAEAKIKAEAEAAKAKKS